MAIKVLYVNTEDLRNEVQEHANIFDLKRFIEDEAEEWSGISRDDPDWEPTEAMVNPSEFKGSQDVYYEKGFGHHHIWIIL